MKTLIPILILFFYISRTYTQNTVFEFTFENVETPSVDNAVGVPTFSTTAGFHGFFTGLNTTCSGTVSGTLATSKNTWEAGDVFQFDVNTTGFSTLDITACFRISERLNAGKFDVVVNGTDIGDVDLSGATSGTKIVGFSGSLPVSANNSGSVTIQFVKDIALPATGTAIRIDNVILNAAVSLPVKFSDISVETKDKANIIYWKTLSELNNDYFDVERSTDGRSFSSIGRVKGGKDGETERFYHFKDNAPFAGTSYYRIRQVDYDGKSSYSDVVSAINADAINSAVEARIQGDMLKVKSNEHISIILYSMDGRVLGSYQLGSYEEIDISHIPNQIIIAKVLGAGVNPQSFKLSKND